MFRQIVTRVTTWARQGWRKARLICWRYELDLHEGGHLAHLQGTTPAGLCCPDFLSKQYFASCAHHRVTNGRHAKLLK